MLKSFQLKSGRRQRLLSLLLLTLCKCNKVRKRKRRYYDRQLSKIMPNYLKNIIMNRRSKIIYMYIIKINNIAALFKNLFLKQAGE